MALEAVGGGQVRCLAIWGKRLAFHLLKGTWRCWRNKHWWQRGDRSNWRKKLGCVCVERKKGAAEMYGNVSVCVEKGAFGNAIVQWNLGSRG